jgi:hypothetical protein
MVAAIGVVSVRPGAWPVLAFNREAYISGAGEYLGARGKAYFRVDIPPADRAIMDGLCFLLFMPCLLAFSFMNCKNTTLRAIDPDPDLNRFRERHGHPPFLRYHTIDIEPMKKILRVEGGVETNGLKKALHIVRGHFATYSEDRPLFGRPGLHGSFWMPAHVRGSLDRGVVVSDYNVNGPGPEAPG